MMCGINGFLTVGRSSDPISAINKMNNAIEHRGPDDEGFWLDENLGIVLGHRRLSIQDLSDAGKQPMHSNCGRYVLIFNGEVYNHYQLREELVNEGFSVSWRGHSDTETILACITSWGIERTLQAITGMFAIGLWDRQKNELTLARDRMGEKPLYWGWQGNSLYFSSELEGLKSNPDFKPEVDRDALTLLLRHNCIPAPYSIYQNIKKLRPGHWIQLPLTDLDQAKKIEPKSYWSLNTVVESGLSNPFSGSPDEAVKLLDSTLTKSVGDQMISDVPIGAFLSGGIDSSTIVALMQKQSSQPVNTFTIGFDDSKYNEAQYAKIIANHLGTNHTELYLKPEDALSIIPKLPSIYTEPFADSSQIPTYLVSQLASQKVKVSLSGDGADELFGGYNHYVIANKIWNIHRKLPRAARQPLARLLRVIPYQYWNTIFSASSPILPQKLIPSNMGKKIDRLANVLRVNSSEEYFRALTSHFQRPEEIVIGSKEPETLISNPNCWPKTDSFQHAMMAIEAQTYMPEDILVKVDRAAMAHSLETRIPLLDHSVVELAWRMPLEYKIREGRSKWILREVLAQHVPREMVERPKKGFSIPLDDWLRGPLRDWSESLLDENLLKQQGYFYPKPVRKMWQEHLTGTHNHQNRLWSILMFQAWLEIQ